MKTAAILYVRNDDYKEDERVIVTLSSMLDTFDEVILLDWNTPEEKDPLLWQIEDKLPKTGRLKHMVIPQSLLLAFCRKKDFVSGAFFSVRDTYLD